MASHANNRILCMVTAAEISIVESQRGKFRVETVVASGGGLAVEFETDDARDVKDMKDGSCMARLELPMSRC